LSDLFVSNDLTKTNIYSEDLNIAFNSSIVNNATPKRNPKETIPNHEENAFLSLLSCHEDFVLPQTSPFIIQKNEQFEILLKTMLQSIHGLYTDLLKKGINHSVMDQFVSYSIQPDALSKPLFPDQVD
jgi:hypothetical protein